ncbi:MAG: UDP-N-acetylglucosamine pyrophosphorylase [Nannocystaceae bacterium]
MSDTAGPSTNDASARALALDERVHALAARGVVIVDPRQTYVDERVRVDRICAGAILHPGTRLVGARTFLGPGAEVGREGPATLIDAVLGAGARVDGGFAQDAVLLGGASAGSAAHLRGATLLEEEASTAHAVGLKHTILLAFVTLGSLINFCDALITGGTSRRDHSEVGSGYIHFNFTPWGERGDKATPSRCGDVPRGVFLRERRIFLGGSGGMIGPCEVGYGSVVGAGSLLRRDVGEGRLVVTRGREVDRPLDPGYLDPAGPRLAKNRRYLGNLLALRAWYQQVRRPRIPAERGHEAVVIDEAIRNLDLAIDERIARADAFARERGVSLTQAKITAGTCPIKVSSDRPELAHLEWVRALDDHQRRILGEWLARIVDHATR